ncbi:MAG: hypothetical protein AAGA23_07095 [Pseudomonadota bacterium]
MLEGAAQALLREQSALFHRATLAFTRDPGLLCREIPGRAVEVTSAQAALGLEEALPLLATDGQFGVEFCFQVTDWRLEDLRISPSGGAATMPMTLAGGVICPRSGAAQAGSYCLVQGFCLELLLLLDTRWVGGGRCPQLEVSLSALEMADLRPELLEDDLACYVATTLEVGIVPRIRRALDCILFELGHEVSRRSAPETLPGSRRSTELVRVS